jgi:hemerythrin-like domain-containing protein
MNHRPTPNEAKLTEVLKEEHQAIKRVLEVLAKVSLRLEGGKNIDSQHLDQMIEVFRVFVDQCHHAKEERVLFPAMEQYCPTKAGCPVFTLIAEHERGRAYVRDLARAVEEIKARDREALTTFTQNARDYINLLRPHMEEEEGKVFPFADRKLSKEEQDAAVRDARRIEEQVIGQGRHEYLHRVIEGLEKAY